MPKLEKCIDRLRKLQDAVDPEIEHKEADAILCEFLRFLGYDDLVDEYEKV